MNPTNLDAITQNREVITINPENPTRRRRTLSPSPSPRSYEKRREEDTIKQAKRFLSPNSPRSEAHSQNCPSLKEAKLIHNTHQFTCLHLHFLNALGELKQFEKHRKILQAWGDEVLTKPEHRGVLGLNNGEGPMFGKGPKIQKAIQLYEDAERKKNTPSLQYFVNLTRSLEGSTEGLKKLSCFLRIIDAYRGCFISCGESKIPYPSESFELVLKEAHNENSDNVKLIEKGFEELLQEIRNDPLEDVIQKESFQRGLEEFEQSRKKLRLALGAMMNSSLNLEPKPAHASKAFFEEEIEEMEPILEGLSPRKGERNLRDSLKPEHYGLPIPFDEFVKFINKKADQSKTIREHRAHRTHSSPSENLPLRPRPPLLPHPHLEKKTEKKKANEKHPILIPSLTLPTQPEPQSLLKSPPLTPTESKNVNILEKRD